MGVLLSCPGVRCGQQRGAGEGGKSRVSMGPWFSGGGAEGSELQETPSSLSPHLCLRPLQKRASARGQGLAPTTCSGQTLSDPRGELPGLQGGRGASQPGMGTARPHLFLAPTSPGDGADVFVVVQEALGWGNGVGLGGQSRAESADVAPPWGKRPFVATAEVRSFQPGGPSQGVGGWVPPVGGKCGAPRGLRGRE